jgi:hypothetical protein
MLPAKYGHIAQYMIGSIRDTVMYGVNNVTTVTLASDRPLLSVTYSELLLLNTKCFKK